jgi:hypothetical protein
MAAPKTQTLTDVLTNPLTVRPREAAELWMISERLVWDRERTTSDDPQETAVVSGLQREMRCESCIGAFGTPRKPPKTSPADRSRDSPSDWPNYPCSRGRPFWRSWDAGRSGSRLKDRSITNHAG